MTAPTRSQLRNLVAEYIHTTNELALSRMASEDVSARLRRATRDQEQAAAALIAAMATGQALRLGPAVVVCRKTSSGASTVELSHLESLDD